MQTIIKTSIFRGKKLCRLIAIKRIILIFLIPGTPAAAQCEVDFFNASDPSPWAHFGDSVATTLDGQYIVAGAVSDDENGSAAGAAYIYSMNQGSWDFQTKLLASDGEAADSFGFNVVITGDGNYAAIASPGSNIGAGAVYVFQRQGSSWQEIDKLATNDGTTGDFLGIALAISDDAMTIAAGADTAEKAGESVGSLYIFLRKGNKWIQQAKLTASDGQAADGFGNEAAISSGGNLVMIGAKGDDDGVLNAGSAYVFERSVETWVEIVKLYASFPDENANFGAAISLSDDGNTALIGARNEGATHAGAAYIFVRQGEVWIEQAHLLPPQGLGGFFGADVSISDDGNTAMVAASEEFGGRGSAYIFAREGGEQWSQQARITSCSTGSLEYFASAIALSGNSNIAVAGARAEGGQYEGQGRVHVFDLNMEPCFVGDLSCDGVVDTLDLLLLFFSWGPCENCFLNCNDLTGDCVVGTADLLVLFANWG